MSFYESLAHGASLIFPFALEHLWQATLLGLFAIAVALLLRRAPARARYIVWLLALVKFAVPSALIAFAAKNFVFNRFAHLFVVDDSSADNLLIVREMAEPVLNPFAAMAGGTATEATTQSSLYFLLAIVWVAGATVLFIRSLQRRRKFWRVIETSQLLDEGREWRLLQAAKLRLNVRRDIRLVVSPHVGEPGVWGAWRRITIALPEGIGERLTDEELETVMLHELIHVARYDNLVSHFQMFVSCLFWFHPLVWIISRKLLEERERACDEAVVRACSQSEIYAASILKVLRFCLHSPVAGASSAGGANLRRRLEYIMTGNANKTLSVWHSLSVTMMIVLGVVFSLITISQNGATAQTTSVQPQEGEARTRNFVITTRRRAQAGQESESSDPLRGEDPAAFHQLREGAEAAIREVAGMPDYPIQIENNSDSPLVINEARMKSVTGEQLNRIFTSEVNAANRYATLPVVTIFNNSDRTIREILLYFGRGGRRNLILGQSVQIAPHTAYTLRADWQGLNGIMAGDTEGITVGVQEVIFEGGGTWGTPPLPPAPPLPSDPPAPPDPSADRIRFRVLNRVQPRYPAEARARGIQGEVTVEFTVNSQGEVVEARAIDGPEELRQAAVDSIRQSRFSPAPGDTTATRRARLNFRMH
jgi:TonB family protein